MIIKTAYELFDTLKNKKNAYVTLFIFPGRDILLTVKVQFKGPGLYKKKGALFQEESLGLHL